MSDAYLKEMFGLEASVAAAAARAPGLVTGVPVDCGFLVDNI